VAGRRPTELARLILTASGGPFRTWGAERVSRATVAEALKHPTWTMGKKITVDSATLVNKALEVIEAHFLFDVNYDQVEVVIHPQSVIHGFAEFVDGSVLAQVGFPRWSCRSSTHSLIPTAYRIRRASLRPRRGGYAHVRALQPERFPAYVVGREAARLGGTAPARFNAANEVAVQLFLEERITFGRIAEIIEHVVDVGRGTGDEEGRSRRFWRPIPTPDGWHTRPHAPDDSFAHRRTGRADFGARVRHFIVAKAVGIQVLRFSLGFGRR